MNGSLPTERGKVWSGFEQTLNQTYLNHRQPWRPSWNACQRESRQSLPRQRQRSLEASLRTRSTFRALRAGCLGKRSRGWCLKSCALIWGRSRTISWQGIQNYEFPTRSSSRRRSPPGFPSERFACTESRSDLSEYFPFVTEIVHSLPWDLVQWIQFPDFHLYHEREAKRMWATLIYLIIWLSRIRLRCLTKTKQVCIQFDLVLRRKKHHELLRHLAKICLMFQNQIKLLIFSTKKEDWLLVLMQL